MVTIAKTKQPVRMPRFGHRVDKTDPILRGCVGWWPLNDGAGRKAKDIVGTNDLSGSGGYGWSNQSIGTVAASDGVDAKFSGSSLGQIEDFTISFWGYYDGTNNLSDFASNRVLGIAGAYPGFVFGSSGNSAPIRFFVDDGSGNSATLEGAKVSYLPNDTWLNFCGTWDQSSQSIKIYIDGVDLTTSFSLSATGSTIGVFTSSDNFTVAGRPGTTTRSLGGNMQNLRFYNRALSATEVSRLYTEPWAGLEPLSPFSFFSVPTAGAPLAVFYNHYKNQGII